MVYLIAVVILIYSVGVLLFCKRANKIDLNKLLIAISLYLFAVHIFLVTVSVVEVRPHFEQFAWHIANKTFLGRISTFVFCWLIFSLFPTKLKNVLPNLTCFFHLLWLPSAIFTIVIRFDWLITEAKVVYWFVIILDILGHMALGLYSLARILKKQFIRKIKDGVICYLVLVVLQVVAIALNGIFNLQLMYLTFDETSPVYGIYDFGNSYLNLVIFNIGLIVIILIGYWFAKLVQSKSPLCTNL